MDLKTWTNMVCELTELCRSADCCVGCSPVNHAILQSWLGDDLFAKVVRNPIIAGALRHPSDADAHCSLRQFLDELLKEHIVVELR